MAMDDEVEQEFDDEADFADMDINEDYKSDLADLADAGMPGLKPFTRSDLKGQLPQVYNGKTAEQWCHLYCQAVLKNKFQGKTAEEWYNECHRG